MYFACVSCGLFVVPVCFHQQTYVALFFNCLFFCYSLSIDPSWEEMDAIRESLPSVDEQIAAAAAEAAAEEEEMKQWEK